MSRPPNFLILMCDQQSRSQLGCYGSLVGKTPSLDRLAASGMRFTGAVTQSPVCTPARAAIFTGLLPEHSGAWCNGPPIYDHVRTMGEVFGAIGYDAAYIGKWHLDGENYFGSGRPARGFDAQWWYDGTCYGRELGEAEFTQYKQMGSMELLRQRGIDDAYCWATRVSDRAERFLETRRGERPWLMVASYDEPHPPLVCPVSYLDMYRTQDMPVPASLHEDLSSKPRIQQEWALNCRQKWKLSEATLREGLHHWYACNTFVDAQIGRVLDAVDRRWADNTVIIYMTDHGDFYGAHGLLGKGPAMYDEIAAVPLLVRAPGLTPAGAVCDTPCSTLDLMPTMLELAGAAPEGLDGTSILPSLRDGQDPRRTAAVFGWSRFDWGGNHFGGMYPIRSIRTRTHKLNLNLLDRDELYDLQCDPCELNNLIDSPAHAEVRDRLHDQLLSRLMQSRDMFAGDTFRYRPWRREVPLAPFQGP